MKPMLLCRDNPDTSKLQYPLYAAPKLDGIRCVVLADGPYSRTLKKIPNKHIQHMFNLNPFLHHADGELIVGKPTNATVYRDTNSVVMSHDKVVDFTYYIFDMWGSETMGYEQRMAHLSTWKDKLPPFVKILDSMPILNEGQLLTYEAELLDEGYEGLIIRYPDALYKYGRTTMKENNTYKLKRFVDDEAVIVGFEEEMHNGNEAETNELGRTKRSTAKSGLTGKGTLGSFICKTPDGVQFNIGSGFDTQDRKQFWDDRKKLVSAVVKYKHFPIGVKDKPRHPIFLGFRDMEIDG